MLGEQGGQIVLLDDGHRRLAIREIGLAEGWNNILSKCIWFTFLCLMLEKLLLFQQ